MEFERIKVEARFLMLGCIRSAAGLGAFMFLVDALRYVLLFLLLLKINSLTASVQNRIILASGFAMVFMLWVLKQCAKLIENRWLMSAVIGRRVSIIEQLTDFSLTDIKTAIEAYFSVAVRKAWRFMLFMLVPAVMLVSTLWVGERGVQMQVLFVLLAGSACALAVGATFYGVTRLCVDASDTLCCYGNESMKDKMTALSRCNRKLAAFELSLGLINRGCRKQAKLLYAQRLFCKYYVS